MTVEDDDLTIMTWDGERGDDRRRLKGTEVWPFKRNIVESGKNRPNKDQGPHSNAPEQGLLLLTLETMKI